MCCNRNNHHVATETTPTTTHTHDKNPHTTKPTHHTIPTCQAWCRCTEEPHARGGCWTPQSGCRCYMKHTRCGCWTPHPHTQPRGVCIPTRRGCCAVSTTNPTHVWCWGVVRTTWCGDCWVRTTWCGGVVCTTTTSSTAGCGGCRVCGVGCSWCGGIAACIPIPL